ncbi:hypothetical protein [Actinomycetospora flava]|uniref:Uncharacterized protein n=1 Tax=Actinomycetospora flava TaxID=3129232 RepID=A0ABU8M974_9PSEU
MDRTTRGPAHGRPRGRTVAVAHAVLTAVAIFVLALLLVTGVEVVLGHTLSGDDSGSTSLGIFLHGPE